MKRTMLLCALICCTMLAFANKPIVPTTANRTFVFLTEKDFDFSVLNLTAGELTLKVRIANGEEAYIYLENKNGIPVSSQRVKLLNQEDILTINISDLPSNSYRLTLASANKKVSKTILIP